MDGAEKRLDKENSPQQQDSKKSFYKETIKDIVITVIVSATIFAMGWPIYRDYMRKALIHQALTTLGSLVKEQLSFRGDPQRGAGRFANSIEELKPKFFFPFYVDEPSDCNDSLWYSLTHEQKRKTNGRWACDGDFAYSVSNEDNCDETIFSANSISRSLAYVVPVTNNTWVYPDDLRIGACMNSKFERKNK